MVLFQLGRFTDLFPWVRSTTELGYDPGPRYNVAPMTLIPALTAAEDRFIPLQWGLVPHFMRDAKVGGMMLNARSETVRQKPSFRAAFRKSRCLIPADGFYEWKKHPGEKTKTPFFIRPRDESGMMLAGLWTTATLDDQELSSCTVLTTSANAFMSKLHDRMPVILNRTHWRQWLDDTDLDRVAGLMRPAPDDLLHAHAVSRQVNIVGVDDPGLIKPVEVTGQQECLFGQDSLFGPGSLFS